MQTSRSHCPGRDQDVCASSQGLGITGKPDAEGKEGQRLNEATKLAAARLWAASKFPYLASSLFACRLVLTPNIKSIAVDRYWRMYVDPELLNDLPVQAVGSMLVHHAAHLLRDHAARADGAGVTKTSEKRWVLAADAEINDDLADSALELPGEPVTPEVLGLSAGRFAEEYFHALHEQDAECPECGSGSDGQPRSWDQPPDTTAVAPSTAHLIKCQVASECLKCDGKEPGSVPAGWLRWAEAILKPKVNWRQVLAAEIRQGVNSMAGAVDYSYSRPSRRASSVPDVVLPSLKQPVPSVAVVCDTSGSMSEPLLERVLAEVDGILRGIGLTGQGIHVLAVDAAVHTVKKVSSARQVQLLGGGGTNMGAGIDAALDVRPRPGVIVVLTDGYTPWPVHGPKGVKVIIGLIGSSGFPTPSWARTVSIDEAV